MTDLHIWIYFWVLVGYLVAGFIKGWNTAYLIVGAVVFVLSLLLFVVSIIFYILKNLLQRRKMFNNMLCRFK